MFLVSVIGTICAGKSTLIRELRRLPCFHEAVFTSIDQCRIQSAKVHKGLTGLEIEYIAWEILERLALRALKSKHLVFVESSGASWRIKTLYQKLDPSQVFIVRLDANYDICVRRLETRKKVDIPFPYNLDPFEGIDNIIEIIKSNPCNLALNSLQKPEQLVLEFLKSFSLFRAQNEEKLLDRFSQLELFPKFKEVKPEVKVNLDPIEIPKEMAPDLARFSYFVDFWKRSDCKKCYLGTEGRSQIVVYRGRPTADIVLLGEAPGADEDIKGKPFVGKAGRLLDEVLQAVKIYPEDCYFGNICHCRPSNNTTPTEMAWAACRPYLDQELSLKDKVRPIKAIITVGAVALKALTGNTKLAITKEVGKWFSYQVNDRQVPVFSIFHTAYLLRNKDPELRKKMDSHLQKFKTEYPVKV